MKSIKTEKTAWFLFWISCSKKPETLPRYCLRKMLSKVPGKFSSSLQKSLRSSHRFHLHIQVLLLKAIQQSKESLLHRFLQKSGPASDIETVNFQESLSLQIRPNSIPEFSAPSDQNSFRFLKTKFLYPV